ncbi:hypothetical protein CHU92_10105 [Flavobacterium cyanobacteriorum]|uniref:Uncharacterized protein n=1 Tax=Flavobacterium cyanobacteriorum TaxID=2022802 RepID=A0A255Z3X1_9FLAO|nr:GldM family protein [Flavobacterium cyanobacteriorum]OYQ36132.1 hypothetical protein CHU92_10105 [Flavobacterium cyanobacteriorum]
MKFFILLLLLNLSAFAQADTNISVVSAEKMNIVYRGIPNPIKVVYPGADSLMVTAPGLRKAEGTNNYILTPGAGNQVTVTIVAIMPDGTRKAEKKVFRVKGLPAPVPIVYGKEGYVELTKQELINAVVDIDMQGFMFDLKFEVYGFSLILPNKKQVDIEGNKMNDDAIQAIKKLQPKQKVIITKIVYIKNPDPAIDYKRLAPITVKIKN